MFLPREICERAVSTSQPWHGMLHHSYLYILFLCMCATQKNITACLFFFLITTLKHVIFLGTPCKTLQENLKQGPACFTKATCTKSASYKHFWPLKMPKSLVEGGRGKAGTDGEHRNYSVSVPRWPQTAGLFGSALYPLTRLPYNKATKWWVLCSNKIKVTLTRLAAVGD